MPILKMHYYTGDKLKCEMSKIIIIIIIQQALNKTTERSKKVDGKFQINILVKVRIFNGILLSLSFVSLCRLFFSSLPWKFQMKM